jgi:hypothetical protein
MRHWFINHLAAYRLSGLTAPAYVAAAAKEWGRANRWPLVFFVGPLLLLSFCTGKVIG